MAIIGRLMEGLWRRFQRGLILGREIGLNPLQSHI